MSLSTADDTRFPEDFDFRDLAFWFPSIPDPRYSFIGMERPLPDGYDFFGQRPVYLNVFAEPDLENLADLGTMTLRACVGQNNRFWGVRITFSSGREALQIGPEDLDIDEETDPFQINYADGEQITKVLAIYRGVQGEETLAGILV